MQTHISIFGKSESMDRLGCGASSWGNCCSHFTTFTQCIENFLLESNERDVQWLLSVKLKPRYFQDVKGRITGTTSGNLLITWHLHVWMPQYSWTSFAKPKAFDLKPITMTIPEMKPERIALPTGRKCELDLHNPSWIMWYGPIWRGFCRVSKKDPRGSTAYGTGITIIVTISKAHSKEMQGLKRKQASTKIIYFKSS
jgi:hypothetical protein